MNFAKCIIVGDYIYSARKYCMSLNYIIDANKISKYNYATYEFDCILQNIKKS